MKTEKKEFILQAHRDACSEYKKGIEKHWPKLFPKEEFKVGDWVYSLDNSIDYKKGCVYRISSIFPGQRLEYRDGSSKAFKYFRKATPSEIESHLIEEAKRRGFIYGKRFNAVRDTIKGEVRMMDPDGDECSGYLKHNVKTGGSWDYRIKTDTLYNIGYGRFVVYEKGQWAEIIDDPMQKIADEIKAVCKKHGQSVEELRKWL